VETIGSKRSYALIWCMPNNDDDDDVAGGTLKIYGHLVNPDVPYKTLLLSVGDNAAHVVRETLEKYGMDKENPDAFCLVEVY